MAQSVTKKTPTKKLYIGAVIALLIVGTVAAVIFVSTAQTKNTSSIDSYQECADAGYPIQMSFPEVCSVPGGKSFVNQ